MQAARVAILVLFFASLFHISAAAQVPAQARLVPAYAADGVTMIGIRFERIHPESTFARIGLRNGDIVTECNGISVRDSTSSAAVLQEFARAPLLRLIVLDTTGGERLIEVEVPRE